MLTGARSSLIHSIAVGIVCITIGPAPALAGWQNWTDLFKRKTEEVTKGAPGASGTQLSNQEVAKGLKEALSKGTQYAIESLGKKDGFLGNPRVRIPMPQSMRTVEKTLRSLGQEKYADEFVATMNHAAEQAVTQAGPIFGNAIKNLSVQDAMDILKGPDDAATTYFRNKTETPLTEKMSPIVKEATGKAGVTAAYKNLVDRLGFAKGMLSDSGADIDRYVTDKAMDGLFLMIAEEEKRIRENPVSRTTDLLKKVFGSGL
jgi:hypothetical protein